MENPEELKNLFKDFIEKILLLITPQSLRDLIDKKWNIFQSLLFTENSTSLLKEYVQALNKPGETAVSEMITEFFEKSKEKIQKKHIIEFQNPKKTSEVMFPKKISVDELAAKNNDFLQKMRKERINSTDGPTAVFKNVRSSFDEGKPSYLKIQDILKTESSVVNTNERKQFSYSFKDNLSKSHHRNSESIPSFPISKPETSIHSAHMSSFISEVKDFHEILQSNSQRIKDWNMVVSDQPIRNVLKRDPKKEVPVPKTFQQSQANFSTKGISIQKPQTLNNVSKEQKGQNVIPYQNSLPNFQSSNRANFKSFVNIGSKR